MKDEIVIADALNGAVRIHAAVTTAMVEQARLLNEMYPTSCAALGRVMTANALMASDLKDPNARITVRIDGKGPVGSILSQADGRGNVKGFTDNPQVYLFRNSDGKLDVGQAVGRNGTLTVSKDLGLREPFTGVVNLQTGEIGDDFAYYFAVSEQTPSVVGVGVLVNTDYSVKAAGGIFIQLLPNAAEEIIEAAEMAAKTMRPVSASVDRGMNAEEIIRELFPDANIMDHRPVQWNCDCSKDHFARGLALIHEKDLLAMIEEDHGCETVCQYCGRKYQFTEEELKEILQRHQNVENRTSID
ncbi:MAG: Hsp33 family molecular chaperone HslO [Erysipelotrichia bacterium]|nr:Hsp33 family molecular chaperone HslO [Erysipelotrichia bacterium]